MFNKFPKRTGVYHIKDNIEQLELRVHFRHINSLLKLPKFDYYKTINGEWRGRDRDGEHTTTDESEIKIVDIKWQEKLFSETEAKLFMDAKNCLNATQKKYHEWLLAKADAESAASANQTPESGAGSSVSKRKRKKRSKKQIKAKNEPKDDEPKQTREIYTYVHEDNFQHNKNTTTKTDYGNQASVHMFIFAAIDIDTELVHLQWLPTERVLHIYPDFNDIGYNPYFIEIDKDYRHLYAYAIANISISHTATYAADLSLCLPELAGDYVQPHWRTESERDEIFGMPPKRTRRVSMLLELRDAGNFDCNGRHLHVRYRIQLPPHTIDEEGLLEASTHSSSISESGIHHFGYNWQLTLLCEEEYYNDGDLLHIYFEVISIDSWERERVEGYAHLAICLVGASTLELHRLQCVRPAANFWFALERFFIGGRRKFDYRTFFGAQLEVKGVETERESSETDNDEVDVVGDFHSRYGCRMHSTGYLKLSCQRFVQRNCELLGPCTNLSGMTLDDIMCAYREARKRLEAVTSLRADV